MKTKIANYLRKKRVLALIRYKNLSRLERFRITTKILILDILLIATVLNLIYAMGTNRMMVFSQEVAVVQASTIGETQNVASEGEILTESNPQADIETLIVQTFPEAKNEAVALFKAESGLNPDTESWTDRMPDGRPFSIGLTQINLTYHELDGVKCHEAFKGRNYKAVVINEPLYQKCIELAKDPIISLRTARGIYDRSGGNFYKWGAYLSGSYLKFM